MRPIVTAICALPGVSDIQVRRQMIEATLPGFYLLVVRRDEPNWPSEHRYLIRLAERRTFDRWANSSNFETEASWSRKYGWFLPDLAAQVRWARKVCRSGLFDFRSYFSPVQLP